MPFRKRKNEREERAESVADYEEAARQRLRSIGESGGYAFSADEKADVEARLRRMWYGAKREGSKAPPAEGDA